MTRHLPLLLLFCACGPGLIEAPPLDGGLQIKPAVDGGSEDGGIPVGRDDHANNHDEGTRVEAPSRTEGSIQYGGDRDYFRFATSDPGDYVIWTDGDTDTTCQLLSSEGRFLAEDDDSGDERNCMIRFELRGARDYVLKVRHYREQGMGHYGVNVVGPIDSESCGNGELDPGEQCDDGNRAHWDGCDRDCMLEELPDGCVELETERSYYTFVCNNPSNWPDAQESCESFGGNLVTIESEEDGQWLARQGRGGWIGMNDTRVEGEWRWVGRDSDYRNWNDNEPNDWGSGEDCAELLGNGKWNDASCGGNRVFFCERGPR